MSLYTRKERLENYNRKKAAGLEILRKNAQSAYARAQQEIEAGCPETAIRWMDRAHRLARDNPSITFELGMLYLKEKAYEKAYDLLFPLMQKFDFYEGWIALAMLHAGQQQRIALHENLHHIFSRHCLNRNTWPLLADLVRKLDQQRGCCGIIGGGSRELRIESFLIGETSIFLDDTLFLQTAKTRITLPDGWQDKKELRVEHDGMPLVGSPIQLSCLCRTEGGVEVEGDQVKGWLWYPADPERIPVIQLCTADGTQIGDVIVDQEMDRINLERPLFRAKKFSLSLECLPDEQVFFKDEFGRNLMGSPLMPWLEKNSMEFLTALSSASGTLQGRWGKDRDPASLFVPISADYQGKCQVTALPEKRRVVVILPVYGNKDITLDCLNSVLANTPKQVLIQIVNDASPDLSLCSELETYRDDRRVFYMCHDENKGFTASVNMGMAAWPDHDIILLNSDTLVGKGWVQALQQVAYQDKAIGTVTPLSNSADIFSYPCHDQMNPVPSEQEVMQLMKVVKAVHGRTFVDIPTANGFCMFIRHDCLQQVGLFRQDLFAQGYGEENEFCIRARHLGWRHVLAAGVFVGHRSGTSFQQSRSYLMERNSRLLNRLYPDYDRMIHDFAQQDILFPIRRELDLYRLRQLEIQQKKTDSSSQYVLFITHQYQGGVGRAVQERMSLIRSQGLVPILMTPTLLHDGCRMEILFKSATMSQNEIEWLFPNLVFYLPDEDGLLLRLLRKMNIMRIEVHHFFGHHEGVRSLPQRLNRIYDMFIHDYYTFCPRFVLLNGAKEYCHEPDDWQSCQGCVNIDQDMQQNQPVIHIPDWLERSRNELLGARKIYVPSQDCHQRIQRHFPELRTIQVQPLEDDRPEWSLSQVSAFSRLYGKMPASLPTSGKMQGRFRICIIGAIGIEKGFGRLHLMLQDIEKRDLPLEFVLVGKTRNDALLMQSDRIFITGDYQEEEAVRLVSEQQAEIAFLPSICPETWCYTLSVAWRAGLKVVAYDIGTIAERIRDTDRGWLMPLDVSIEQQSDFLLSLCKFGIL